VSASTALETQGLFARAGLSSMQRDEMFALLQRHFDGVTREQFDHDLTAKDWVIEIRPDDMLLGFTTLRVNASEFEGEPITAIYSGDTIVAPEAWGTPALARSWIAGVNRVRASFPGRRCFWLLLTSGFRTYRFLPVFWREFFPCHCASTPARAQRLLNQLAREGYGERFDAQTGIVRFPQPQRLRGRLAGVPEGRDRNSHVAFFLSRNSGHHEGDELVCLTEICDANLTPAGRRVAGVSH
jgi:hypothetical protein